MRSDIDIKRDVEAELRWNPDIDATDIAVAVKDSVVTLTGFVRSYGQKTEASRPQNASPVSSRWRTISRCGCRSSIGGPTPKSPETQLRRSRASCRIHPIISG